MRCHPQAFQILISAMLMINGWWKASANYAKRFSRRTAMAEEKENKVIAWVRVVAVTTEDPETICNSIEDAMDCVFDRSHTSTTLNILRDWSEMPFSETMH